MKQDAHSPQTSSNSLNATADPERRGSFSSLECERVNVNTLQHRILKLFVNCHNETYQATRQSEQVSDTQAVVGFIATTSLYKHTDTRGWRIVLQGSNNQAAGQFGHLQSVTKKTFINLTELHHLEICTLMSNVFRVKPT